MSLFKKDVFGRSYFIKKWVIRIIGFLSYRRFKGINSLEITGTKNLIGLPKNNVLFISNHQTYFADATATLILSSSNEAPCIKTDSSLRLLLSDL